MGFGSGWECSKCLAELVRCIVRIYAGFLIADSMEVYLLLVILREIPHLGDVASWVRVVRSFWITRVLYLRGLGR
jgi:hypothetical protein